MGVRKTVFGSKLERKCFKKLQKTWGEKYNIYHNLPFLNVFDPETAEADEGENPFEISPDDKKFLKKTSIDFVVCDKEDAPLVCIEFDGMRDGVNVGTTYLLPDGTPDQRKRREFLELKLRVAHGSGFPYFVLGSKEFKGLSDSVVLTIADGLIGEVMSVRDWANRMDLETTPQDYGYHSEDWDQLDFATRKEIVEDWAIGVESDCDYENNPIVRKAAERFSQTGSSGWAWTFPKDEDLNDDLWVCAEYTIFNDRYGHAQARVCLPNFKTPYCFFSGHLAKEIAQLLALEKIWKRMPKKERKPKQ